MRLSQRRDRDCVNSHCIIQHRAADKLASDTLAGILREFLYEFFQSAISEFSQRPFRNTLRDPLRATDSEILSETSKRLFLEPSERETLRGRL